MEGKKNLTWPATAIALLMTSTALAGGFNIYEQSARATALGGAFTATADDASAIFYNPAGLGFLEGTVLDLNWMPIISDAKFTGAEPPTPGASGETVDQFFSIPGFFVSHTLPSGWGFGLGLYAPFGLGVEWKNPTEWIGRETSYNVNLATIYVTPAVAYQASERVAVSVGLDIAWQTLELNSFYTTPFGGHSDLLNVVDSKLDGDSDVNVTPCAGVLYKATETLTLGLMYHHEKTMKYDDGDATFTNVVPENDPDFATLRADVDAQISAAGGANHKVTSQLGLPHILSIAAGYQVHPKLHLEIDAVHFGWSHFDKIDLVYDNDPSSGLNQTLRQEYSDSWQFRFGLDWDLAPGWKGMAGYIYDNTPQPVESMGPMLPDAKRNDFSFGVQYSLEKWRFTGSYMVVNFRERSNVVNGQATYFDGSTAEEIEIRTREAGTYDSLAYIFGVGVGYNF